jgi:hypothetical protein
MNMYLFFKNLNILCIFSDRFFDLVFFRFRFLGSTGSMTGSVLVTLVQMHRQSLGTEARHLLQTQPDDRVRGHQFPYLTLGGGGTRVVVSWTSDIGPQSHHLLQRVHRETHG